MSLILVQKCTREVVRTHLMLWVLRSEAPECFVPLDLVVEIGNLGSDTIQKLMQFWPRANYSRTCRF